MEVTYLVHGLIKHWCDVSHVRDGEDRVEHLSLGAVVIPYTRFEHLTIVR